MYSQVWVRNSWLIGGFPVPLFANPWHFGYMAWNLSLYFPLLLPQCLLCHLPTPIPPSPPNCGFPQGQSCLLHARHTFLAHPSLGGCRHLLGLHDLPRAIGPHRPAAPGEIHRPPVWAIFSCLELNCGLSQGCNVPSMGPGMEEALPSALGSWGAPNPVCEGSPSSH